MTEELRDTQGDTDKIGNPEAAGQRGVPEMLTKGAEAASAFIDDIKVPTDAAETVLGTILGCLTVRAFTKAWPRLETPVSTAGYLVGGYAVYRLAKAALNRGSTETRQEEEVSP